MRAWTFAVVSAMLAASLGTSGIALPPTPAVPMPLGANSNQCVAGVGVASCNAYSFNCQDWNALFLVVESEPAAWTFSVQTIGADGAVRQSWSGSAVSPVIVHEADLEPEEGVEIIIEMRSAQASSYSRSICRWDPL